ncbi:MAG: hypothetical protein GY851_09225 [bacterium]|nr:hypothetical protein [bacterium]
MATGATAYPTQGNTIGVANETALGTTGSYKDWRLSADPTIPTETRQVIEQANRHDLATDFTDNPVEYEAGMESALTTPMNIRRGLTTQTAPFMDVCAAAGMQIEDSAADTVTTGAPAVGDFDADDALFGTADCYNSAVLLETVAGTTWEPTLLMEYDTAPDKQCTPAMDAPSIAAVGGDILRMKTAHPFARQVPTTATKSIEFTSRAAENVSNNQTFVAKGCAVADLGTFEVNRDGVLSIAPVWHCADVSTGDTAIASNDYQDTGVPTCHANSSLFTFQFSPGGFSAAGGIANAELELISASINPGITTVPVEGVGSAACLNGWQGYMATIAQPTAELTVLCDADYWDSATVGIQDGMDNTDSYLGFTWGISNGYGTTDIGTGTALGIWMPRCKLLKSPTAELFNGKVLATLTYGGTAPKWTQDSGSISNGDPNAAGICFAMYQQTP